MGFLALLSTAMDGVGSVYLRNEGCLARYEKAVAVCDQGFSMVWTANRDLLESI
jgi:hypothetical protein